MVANSAVDLLLRSSSDAGVLYPVSPLLQDTCQSITALIPIVLGEFDRVNLD